MSHKCVYFVLPMNCNLKSNRFSRQSKNCAQQILFVVLLSAYVWLFKADAAAVGQKILAVAKHEAVK